MLIKILLLLTLYNLLRLHLILLHQIYKILILNILMSEFPSDKLEILKRKDAYPYEWVDSYEKFNYPQLPPKKCFYSSLKDSKSDKSYGHISNEQYLHLQNVWNAFNFNTFENFQSLPKKRCNIILADVFEISTFLNFYELDPCFILVHLVYHWTLC